MRAKVLGFKQLPLCRFLPMSTHRPLNHIAGTVAQQELAKLKITGKSVI